MEMYEFLKGNTSYDLYLNYAKFAVFILYFAKNDKDIFDEIKFKKFDSHKPTAALRVVWLIEQYGAGFIVSLTKVSITV